MHIHNAFHHCIGQYTSIQLKNSLTIGLLWTVHNVNLSALDAVLPSHIPSTKQDRPLGHVITVFNRLGYTMVGPGEDWDVMWSHEYPFNALPQEMWSNLKPQQKVNHFPGSGCFTYKSQLATLNFPFIPKAFRVPQHADKLKAEVGGGRDYWISCKLFHIMLALC